MAATARRGECGGESRSQRGNMIEEWRRRLDRFVVDVLERIFYRWVNQCTILDIPPFVKFCSVFFRKFRNDSFG